MRTLTSTACLLVSVLMTFAGAAHAAEWRYCLALSQEQRRVYMSYPFQCAIDMSRLERMLREALTREGVPVDVVQCPRGDDEHDILAMRDHAVAFNRQTQLTVVDVKWHPAPSLDCE